MLEVAITPKSLQNFKIEVDSGCANSGARHKTCCFTQSGDYTAPERQEIVLIETDEEINYLHGVLGAAPSLYSENYSIRFVYRPCNQSPAFHGLFEKMVQSIHSIQELELRDMSVESKNSIVERLLDTVGIRTSVRYGRIVLVRLFQSRQPGSNPLLRLLHCELMPNRAGLLEIRNTLPSRSVVVIQGDHTPGIKHSSANKLNKLHHRTGVLIDCALIH